MARSERSSTGSSAGAGKRGQKPKLSRADKKALRVAKREKRRETFRNVKQAFVLTKDADPRFLPVLIMSTVVAIAALYVIVLLITGFSFAGYIANRQISTAIYMAHHLQKPILVEGPAGVGKTELAKSVASWLKLPLHAKGCSLV